MISNEGEMAVKNIILIMVTLAIGAARCGGYTDPAFQAVAHLFVGGLIGAWWAGREPVPAALAGWLTLVELTSFFSGRV